MDAPSRLAEVNPPTIPPALHIRETFHPSDECDIYDADLIRTILSKSYHHSFIYADKYPELPLPVSYTSPRASMDSIHRIILETDINRPSREIPFLHYIDCPPKQSARIPLPCYIPVFGYFSRSILGCFVTTSDSFKKGDVVRLGGSETREAVVEGMGCVGRDFISYDIREVGCLPIESHLTTQLIAPLSSCKPFFLQLLIMVYVTLFSPFIRSSAVFGEDLQDPCAGTEGYAGSLDEAERGVV
jgi:hypothetical protein